MSSRPGSTTVCKGGSLRPNKRVKLAGKTFHAILARRLSSKSPLDCANKGLQLTLDTLDTLPFMIHRLVTVLLLVLVLCCSASEESSETYESPHFPSAVDRLGCLKYGIDVEITGTLTRESAGALSASSDQAHSSWYRLHLPRPICAAPFPLDGHYPAISDVTRILLVIDSSAETGLAKAVGRQVRMKGMAFPRSGETSDSVVILKVASWAEDD
jgi:hypothetical protein